MTEADIAAAVPHVTAEAHSELLGGGGSGGQAAAPATGGAGGAGGVGWDDVGGLDDVKRVLRECVILPRDHPEIFALAPLRLTGGALLYGPSGCGTLVSSSLMRPRISATSRFCSAAVGSSQASVWRFSASR